MFDESPCLDIPIYLLYTRERERINDNRTNGCILFVSGSGRRRRRHYGRTGAVLTQIIIMSLYIHSACTNTHTIDVIIQCVCV